MAVEPFAFNPHLQAFMRSAEREIFIMNTTGIEVQANIDHIDRFVGCRRVGCVCVGGLWGGVVVGGKDRECRPLKIKATACKYPPICRLAYLFLPCRSLGKTLPAWLFCCVQRDG